MSILDLMRGDTSNMNIPDEIKRLSDAELRDIMNNNPYHWSVGKMACVAQEMKNRGLK